MIKNYERKSLGKSEIIGNEEWKRKAVNYLRKKRNEPSADKEVN